MSINSLRKTGIHFTYSVTIISMVTVFIKSTLHRSKVNGYQFNNWDSIPGRFRNNSLHHHVLMSYG